MTDKTKIWLTAIVAIQRVFLLAFGLYASTYVYLLVEDWKAYLIMIFPLMFNESLNILSWSEKGKVENEKPLD